MTEIVQDPISQQLKLLEHLVESVSRSSDFLSALGMVLKDICEAMALPYGEAWLPNADATEVTLSPAFYIAHERLWPFRNLSEEYTFKLGVGLPGRILESKSPLWIDDVRNNPSYLRAPAAGSSSLGAAFGVPVITKRGLAAILVFYTDTPCREDPALISLANSVAVQLGWLLLSRQTEDEARRSRNLLEHAVSGTVSALEKTLEMRDPYTAGHDRRVAELAVAIARKMRFSEEQLAGIRIAGYLHDLGKIVVPAEILAKPGRINEYEFGIIRAHANASHKILQAIDFPWPIAEAAFAHHERLDGSGYPRGLEGNEIIREAKIIAIADVVEAMSSHRPYRPELGTQKALEEIEKNRGRLYDPQIADVCLELFRTDNYTMS